MLGKLHDMAKSKRKPKKKASGGRKLNPAGNERSSDTFGYEGRRPEHTFSADGYSKDCYDELRDAIREGLAKQNLLPKSFNEEKAYFDKTKKFSEEKAYFDKTKHFTEEKGYYLDRKKVVSEEKSYFYRTKSDASMEFPSTSSDQSSMFHSREFDTSDNSFQWSFEEKDKGPKSSSFNPHIHLGNERSLNSVRPIVDMDLPKPKMPHFSLQKADSQRRPLEELIQTVQFRGLLTSPTPDHKKSLTDDSPHIVIIKPLRVADSPEVDHVKQKFISLDLDTKEIIRKLKMKEMVPSRTKNVTKGALDMNELQRKLQGEMSRLENVIPDKYYIDASTRTDDIAIKLMEKISSSKMKASVPAKAKVQIKEVIDYEGYRVQKLATNTRKAEEDQISHNTNKIASTSCSVLQDQTSQLPASTPTSLDCASTRKNKANPEKLESISASTPLVETRLKKVTVQSDTCYEHEQDSSATKLTTSKEVPVVDQINHASGNLDYWNKTESHLSDYATVIEQKSDDAKTTNKSNENVTRNVLLGNPLFLNKVEELFYSNAYDQPLAPRTSRDYNDMSADDELLLDCAKELLENKSLQLQSTTTSTRGAIHGFWHTHTNKTKKFMFVDQLVSEVCDGMDDLRRYKKLPNEKFAQDTLPKGLQKDLWCKGVVNGGWDFGWRSGFTAVEVEQIVVSIEHEILNGIIEDTLADMES